jgi:hypothetical protein
MSSKHREDTQQQVLLISQLGDRRADVARLLLLPLEECNYKQDLSKAIHSRAGRARAVLLQACIVFIARWKTV